jgi:drug/metabolite transporter (DMT)-like permease
MLALRHLGVAREAGCFSTAAFIGATLSIPIFGMLPTTWEMLGMIAMVAGVYLMVREQHSHLHIHEQIEQRPLAF